MSTESEIVSTTQDKLDVLREKYFLGPDGNNVSVISQLFSTALHAVNDSRGEGPTYPIQAGIPSITDLVETARIPEEMVMDPEDFLRKLPSLIQGAVRSGHPFMVKNIIPTASLPALAAYIAVSPLMGNGVSGEDSAQILLAEPACAAAISKLAGIDHTKSAGVFTFGGTGTNLYGMKIGLSKALPEQSKRGIYEEVVVIEAAPSHYSHRTAVDWLGIGQDRLVRVSSHPDQTTKFEELEEKAEGAVKSGKKIACIVASAGTTSNMGIDDIKRIYDLRERLVQEYGLSYRPHIHADSVLGWAFLNFRGYDFDTNPLDFKATTLDQLKKIVSRISTVQYADSFGVDFHKSGYMAYTSSMVIVKDRQDLARIQREGSVMTPLFHDDEAYNPGKFTLETSRSSANMLATWVGLQTFGQEGYQLLLGHAIEMGLTFREAIEKHTDKGLFIANQMAYGPDVFVRCYPQVSDAKKDYGQEMSDDQLLKKNNQYTTKFFEWLSKVVQNSRDSFAVSKSSAAIYTHTGAPMMALRIYPLSPYITEETAQELTDRLVKMKVQFDLQNHVSP